MNLEQTLSKLAQLQDASDNVLQRIWDYSTAVQEQLSKIRELFVTAEEAMTNQAKLNPTAGEKVNLSDGDNWLTLRQLIDGMPAVAKIEDRNVQKKAKPLYALCHPDKGGDPVLFDQLRKAVRVRDAETVYLISCKLGKAVALDPIDVMEDRAKAKLAIYQTSPSHTATKLWLSGNQSKAADYLVQHLQRKHALLWKKLVGDPSD